MYKKGKLNGLYIVKLHVVVAQAIFSHLNAIIAKKKKYRTWELKLIRTHAALHCHTEPHKIPYRAVGTGGEGAIGPLYYDRPINSNIIRGTDYAHHITTQSPPGFQTFLRPCHTTCCSANLTSTMRKKITTIYVTSLWYKLQGPRIIIKVWIK